MTQATKPVCSMPGCDQEIWYKPEEHDVCAGCRKRGGPPPPPAPEPEPVPLWWELRPEMQCSSPECGRAITAPHRTGSHCMRCHREHRPDLRGAELIVVGESTFDLSGGHVLMYCGRCRGEMKVEPSEAEAALGADSVPHCGC